MPSSRLGAPRDADLRPRIADLLRAISSEQFIRLVNSHIGESLELGSRRDLTASHGIPPNLACFLPGIAAERYSCQVESFVGNAREDVDAALVLGDDLEVFEVRNLRIFALSGC